MSDDYDQHIILQHLDDPLRFLHWTVDEAIAIVVPIFFCFAIDHAIYGIFGAGGSFFLLKYIKKKFGLESLKHVLYWFLPKSEKKLPNSPASHIREYIG